MKTMPRPRAFRSSDDAKQHLHFLRVEAGGRLVENQHLAGEIDGAGDRHDLLDGDGKAVELLQSHRCRCRIARAARAPAGSSFARRIMTEPARLAAEKEIFGDAQIGSRLTSW